jgi:hypothetical protein
MRLFTTPGIVGPGASRARGEKAGCQRLRLSNPRQRWKDRRMTWPSTSSTPCTPGVCCRPIYRGLPTGKRRDIQIVKLSAPSTSTTYLYVGCVSDSVGLRLVIFSVSRLWNHPSRRPAAQPASYGYSIAQKSAFCQASLPEAPSRYTGEVSARTDGSIKAEEGHDVLPM